jgi:hypothetical protein
MLRDPIEEMSGQISKIEWPHRSHQNKTHFLFDLLILPGPTPCGTNVLVAVRALPPARRVVAFRFSHAKLIFSEREVQLRSFLGHSWLYPVGTGDPNASLPW